MAIKNSLFFLSKTKDINAYDGNNIPLITACRKEDAYMTGLLLGKGADVNQTDALGCSPLLWACVHRNLNIVTMLLNEGAVTENIDVYSKSSPLIWVFLGEFLYLCKSAHITEDFHSFHNNDEFPSLLEGNINGQFYTQEEIIDAFLTVLQNGYSRGCIIAKDKYAQSKTPRLVRPVQNILEIIYRGNTEVYFDTSFQPNTASPFVEVMNLFFARGIDIDKSSIGGITALCFACMIDIHNSPFVSYLLSNGASVHKCDNEGTYPLEIAIRLGKEGLVKILIDNGANVNLPVEGISPIDWAIRKENMSIVDSLINAGANLDKRYENGTTLLHFAIKSENDELLKSLLRGGISVTCEDYSGETPLMIAVNRGLVNIVTILITEGAEADTCNSNGISPLMLASSKGDFDIVNMMLRNTQFTPSRTVNCLFSACRNNYLKLVGLLIDRGFDTNITEPNHENTCLLEAKGSTPVSGAICSGNDEIVAYLIEHEANVNTQDLKGFTPLMLAASKGHYNIVKMLVENKGDITPQNEEGFTCVSEASAHGNDAILAYFIEHGADVNIPNIKGNTPLMLAASNGHLNIVQMLLEHQAGVTIWDKKGIKNKLEFLIHERAINKANNSGYSSLMLASKNGHASIVQMLLDNGANMYIINKRVGHV
ncbi:unnamed protein product [Mytilus edulis]|uniref:Ankyrin repeat protein n=1 Tax=Mytilus edulis TaxID=6550 RepID=A0A8S3REH7_MYTED|nr:unnamed protein product [Mytilus edulis]